MKTELRNLKGRVVIYVDGHPYHGIFCSSSAQHVDNFLDAGFQVIDTHPGTPLGWLDLDTFDYSTTDRKTRSYLEKKHDALLIVRFWLGYDDLSQPGHWWLKRFPQDLTVTYHGSTRPSFPTFASQQWQRAAARALHNVISYLEEKYSDRIFAYVPGGGPCGEWFHWFTYWLESNQDPDDYSEPMRRGFAEYLADLYQGNIEALNHSWHTTFGSFDEITLPTPKQRTTPLWGSLRDPYRERFVLDFYQYYNGLVADVLIQWSKAAKEATKFQKLVFVFYGYQWVSSARHSLARSGHLDLARILQCDFIDGIVAPYIYDCRKLGGVVSSQTVPGSVRQGKKLLINELDLVTHRGQGWMYPAKQPSTAQETVEIMKRDLAYSLAQGAACWFMDLHGGMFDDPELIAGLRQVREVGEELWLKVGEPQGEVAVILHEQASLYFGEGEPFLAPLFNLFKVWELERMGLPFVDLVLSSLADHPKDYKVYIIPNAVFLSDEERRLIKERCCTKGNTVIWCYAAGVLDREHFSIALMEELTGMRLGYTMEPGELTVSLTNEVHPYLEGLSPGLTYGTKGSYLCPEEIREQTLLNIYPEQFSIAPRIWVTDDAVTVLGTIEDLRKPGLAVKRMPGWISVFSAAPMIPKEILRNIAKAAGCHVYTEFPGQLMAAENLVGFYAHKTGLCRIHLPILARVTDAFTRKVIHDGTKEVVLPVKENTTTLLYLEKLLES